MMPVVLSLPLTFAIMALSGTSLNPANLMVLPLMFGIGVDAGIHVPYRARMNGSARLEMRQRRIEARAQEQAS